MAATRFITLVSGVKQWALGLAASAGVSSAGSIVALNASGLIDPTMHPALNGDVTSSAGSTATSVVKVNGAAVPTSAASLATNSAGQLIVGSASAINWSIGEIPSGPVGGVYTAAHTPVAGSIVVFIDGLRRQPGAGNDYTVSGAAITPLVQVNSIVIDYRY